MVTFLRTGKKVEVLNPFSWFRLKEKLLDEKMDTSVFCPYSKELWKVLAESEPWFPISRKKIE